MPILKNGTKHFTRDSVLTFGIGNYFGSLTWALITGVVAGVSHFSGADTIAYASAVTAASELVSGHVISIPVLADKRAKKTDEKPKSNDNSAQAKQRAFNAGVGFSWAVAAVAFTAGVILSPTTKPITSSNTSAVITTWATDCPKEPQAIYTRTGDGKVVKAQSIRPVACGL